MHFGTLLKQLDGFQYNSYVMERFSEGLPSNQPHQKNELFKMSEPVFEKKNETLLDSLLDRLDKLPKDHMAVKFCDKRKIPHTKFDKIYYIDDMRKISQLSEKYKEKIKTDEPRIIFPFYNENGSLIGITCRALNNEFIKYITIKIKEDEELIYGVDKLDKSKLIYVVEGPIDSLFLPNSIAVSGTAFNKIQTLNLPKDKLVIIFDNQPRNKEVVKLLDRVVENNFQVVIWPQFQEEKDINDLVLSGKDPLKIIKNNIFKGLEAKNKFIAWKRC